MMDIKYNVRRVNKFNLLIIWGFSVLLTMQAFIVNGQARGLKVLFACLSATIIASFLVFFKVENRIASIVIPLLPAISATVLAIIEGGSLRIFTIYIFVFCITALYFDNISLIIVVCVIDLMLLISTFVFNKNIVSNLMNNTEIIVQLFMTNMVAVVLHLLSRWGKEYVISSVAKANELEKANSIMEETAVELNANIFKFKKYIDDTKVSSGLINSVMQQISKGAEKTASDINEISTMISKSHLKLTQTNKISSRIDKISTDVENVVTENGKEVKRLKNHMDTIEGAMNKALKTVADLNDSMENIKSFTEAISNIAKQTDLLAVNASIEAARAGEAGRGFTVVADEIRNLSEKSNKTADEIAEILQDIQENAKDALGVVKSGYDASVQGSDGVDKLSSSIESMMRSFGLMKRYVNAEYKSISQLTEIMNNIEAHIQNNAAIMEEQSSSTEEISAAIKEQDAMVNDMVESIARIENLSSRLKELTELT